MLKSKEQTRQLFIRLYANVYFRNADKAKFVEAMIKGQNITDKHVSIMVTMIQKKHPL